VHVLSEELGTLNVINSSGSTLHKLCRSVLPPQLISSLLAFASFLQFSDILPLIKVFKQKVLLRTLTLCFCSFLHFTISRGIHFILPGFSLSGEKVFPEYPSMGNFELFFFPLGRFSNSFLVHSFSWQRNFETYVIGSNN